MSPENRKLIDLIRRPAGNLIALAFVFSINSYAFKSRRSREIKNTNGICDGCGKNVGKDNLIAAHLNHDRSNKRQYNSRENGRAYCRLCELKHHLSNHDSPFQRIGLNRKNNATTIYSIWQQLNDSERRQAMQDHGRRLTNIIDKF